MNQFVRVLVGAYSCHVEYCIGQEGSITMWPVAGTKNPKVELLGLKEALKKMGLKPAIVPLPFETLDWAVNVYAKIGGKKIAANLLLKKD